MEMATSKEIYRRLTSIQVRDLELMDGSLLARALWSPRERLADNLCAKGVLDERDRHDLEDLWDAMRRIEPDRMDPTPLFENIYDLLLWVYVRIPEYELDATNGPSKLVFRGQRDAAWKLQTTGQRYLKTAQEQADEGDRIQRFLAAIRQQWPRYVVLTSELEQEAVAQHYGFYTSLIDFSTDLEIAAYFATVSCETPQGAIYLADSTTLLHDGRIRFVKIPEPFRRPNVQNGLFLKCDGTNGIDMDDAFWARFRQLGFRQQPRVQLDSLYQSLLTQLGLPSETWARTLDETVEAVDEIAPLAYRIHLRGGAKVMGPSGKVDTILQVDHEALTVLQGRAYPEFSAYPRRLHSLAGVITDDAQWGLATDIVRAIVAAGPGDLKNFIERSFEVVAEILGDDSITDVTGAIPMIQLARNLGQLYLETKDDHAFRETILRLSRAAWPKSILLIEPDSPKLRDKAKRIASRFWLRTDGQRIAQMDCATMKPQQVIRMFDAVETVRAMEAPFVILNLEYLLALIGEAQVKDLVETLFTLDHGVLVTTATAETNAATFTPFPA